jgi:hypothetical protein
MESIRSRKQVFDCLKEAGVALWDKKTGSQLAVHVIDLLIDLITFAKTEEEFIESIELIRFVKTIDDFLLENREEDQSFEFYAQHKKEIDSHKNKSIVFQKRFSIPNISTFKLDFKKREWYLPPFYDEKLRTRILSEQQYRCALCNTDISKINPHLHHIDYNKMNCARKNLAFLCPRCHGKTNSNRNFWKNMLIERQEEFVNVRQPKGNVRKS